MLDKVRKSYHVMPMEHSHQGKLADLEQARPLAMKLRP
ncbi:hypothetical protein GQ55_9G493200 [Panicum hallii var. hallii]|uniref:Uncharacterized protein n=1 Tax=Panicum hallii var. hallii TaxID=1504633 RepID=A0A2T7CDH1_9POAL|nr:hypothetical protein GQ55_9G493200 [Panicum hallii var. hallii]